MLDVRCLSFVVCCFLLRVALLFIGCRCVLFGVCFLLSVGRLLFVVDCC